MENLQRLLATDPMKLRGLLAVPETWRGIQLPARTPTPDVGHIGILGRLGITARRATTPVTARAQPLPGAPSALKLYQPAHQRFYLIGASLVCQRPGMPDRRIDKGKEERASFLIRRWFPPSASTENDLPNFDETTWTEHAFVAQSDGTFAWVPVASAGADEADRSIVLPEEERLPLFPLSFTEDNKRTRRLLGGLVPVGKREAYHAAMRLQDDGSTGAGGPTENAALILLFRKQVSEPWKTLVDRAVFAVRAKLVEEGDAPDGDQVDAQRQDFRSAIQTASWLVLADFRKFLEQYVPAVLTQIDAVTFTSSGTPSRGPLTAGSAAANLYDALVATGRDLDDLNPRLHQGGTVAPRNTANAVAFSLGHALQQLGDDTVTAMEDSEMPYDLTDASEGWPEFLFPLVDIEDTRLDPNHAAYAPTFERSPVPVTTATLAPEEAESVDSQMPPIEEPVDTDDELLLEAAADFKTQIDTLAALVIRAFDFDEETTPQPAVPAIADRPADMRDGWFHIRCVYERPSCGDLHDDVVSGPTERFQLAGFFDPDAPARPIRIGLPVDTTPAGLRKFDKNTAFVMSDILCGQIARMKGLTLGDLVRTVLPWPLHKDLSVPDNGPCKQGSGGPNIGLVCSLSIPIITICALILLMIMVSLLDIIFRWIPYFIVCFPLPGLRAKPK